MYRSIYTKTAMPVGLQRWPLNEPTGDLPPQPEICCRTKCVCNIDGSLPKEDEHFGRGFHRVQELDGGNARDLHNKLDKLRRINHSLEEEMTKLDGMTEKAKTRLEKAQRRAGKQSKRFGCIVELVQQLSCSREIEDLEQDTTPTPSKDNDNIATHKNIFEAVDEKVQRKLHYPNSLGHGPDYLEQLIQSHIPNYPITNCLCYSNNHGCEGGGKCRTINTGIPSKCVGTSSVFRDQHIELSSNGEYVMITNNAPNEVDLGGHVVMQILNRRRMATFALPARVPLSSLATVTIWSNSSNHKIVQPPTDFVYALLNEWCTDAKCITILCSRTGQALSWTTVFKDTTDRQPRLTSPPPFGEEKAPAIDLLSYINTSSSTQDRHCDQKATKYVPFPPLRPSINIYLPNENRCGQLPTDEILYAGASGQRMGSAPLLMTIRTQQMPAINNGRRSCVAPIQ